MGLARVQHPEISHTSRRAVAVLTLIVASLSFAPPLPAQGSGRAPDSGLPFQYAWGRNFMEVSHEVYSSGRAVDEAVSGKLLRFQHEELEVRYHFYMPEKIADITLIEQERDGRRRMVVDEILKAPINPPEEAVFYAVDIRLPLLPILEPEPVDANPDGSADGSASDAVVSGENGEPPATPEEERSRRITRSLLLRLEERYGKPPRRNPRDRLAPAVSRETLRRREAERARSDGKRIAGHLEYKQGDTLVRVFYVEQGGQRYAHRISFTSLQISKSRVRANQRYERESERKIRRRLLKANRELRRQIRREKREERRN